MNAEHKQSTNIHTISIVVGGCKVCLIFNRRTEEWLLKTEKGKIKMNSRQVLATQYLLQEAGKIATDDEGKH